MTTFDRAACQDLSTAMRREWLETNGIGGYASSTILGLNTRRYHGLLVAATRPPLGRMVLLPKMEETVGVAECVRDPVPNLPFFLSDYLASTHVAPWR